MRDYSNHVFVVWHYYCCASSARYPATEENKTDGGNRGDKPSLLQTRSAPGWLHVHPKQTENEFETGAFNETVARVCLINRAGLQPMSLKSTDIKVEPAGLSP